MRLVSLVVLLLGLFGCQERRTSAYGVARDRMQGVYVDNRPRPNTLTLDSNGKYVLRNGRTGRESTGAWLTRFEVHGPNYAEETIRFGGYFSDPLKGPADWIVRLEFCGSDLCFYEDYDSGITFRKRTTGLPGDATERFP